MGSTFKHSQYTEGPFEPVEDDSPVEEVGACKSKKKVHEKMSTY